MLEKATKKTGYRNGLADCLIEGAFLAGGVLEFARDMGLRIRGRAHTKVEVAVVGLKEIQALIWRALGGQSADSLAACVVDLHQCLRQKRPLKSDFFELEL